MSAIKKVALAGATGDLGTAMLQALIDADFEVTVLTRSTSNHRLPSSVKVAKVDYDSFQSLKDAVNGQDAVISTVTSTAIAQQERLIDACIAAGVKRFVPSEFGSDCLNLNAMELPVFKSKIAIEKLLIEKTKGTQTSYTFVISNVFLDWGLDKAFILNLKGRKAELCDGGDVPFSTTTLATVGKGTAGVLKHPEETRDRAVYIQDTITTQNKLLEMAQRHTPGEKWEVMHLNTETQKQWAYEELQKPEPQIQLAMFAFLKCAVWKKGYGGCFEKTDNELLGIKQMSEKEVEEVVKRSL